MIHYFAYAMAVIAVVGLLGAPAISADSPAADRDAIPLEELRTFSDIFNLVKSRHVESHTDADLIRSSIEGMLQKIDPHSQYYNDKDYKNFDRQLYGKTGGVGVRVSMKEGVLVVVSPIKDTPAERAGIKSGDRIVRIDGQIVQGQMTFEDAINLMRGDVGTDVNLSIWREGEEPFTVDITRATIPLITARGEIIGDGYGYVHLSYFNLRVAEDLADILEDLRDESDGDLKGLVLDLRNNPGGGVSAAVDVADAFLEDGEIVSTRGRGTDVVSHYARPGDLLKGAPLVVLINGGSASASEIVAGALQDHHRGVIVGEPSFGKGTVQTIYRLSSGGVIRLTTGFYHTPSGVSIQAEGIQPDILVEPLRFEDTQKEGAVPLLKESNYAGYLRLKSDSESQAEEPDKDAAEDEPKDDAFDFHGDYQLLQAYNILRGMEMARRADTAP